VEFRQREREKQEEKRVRDKEADMARIMREMQAESEAVPGGRSSGEQDEVDVRPGDAERRKDR